MARLPEVRLTVFSDYICPFCYVANARLEALRPDFDLKINWVHVEIHPETPPEGRPVSELNYSPEHWQTLMQHLNELAAEDNLPLREHDFTCNSRKALLLAEAAKPAGREAFYQLHNSLFEAFFVRGENIGQEAVLRKLAAAARLPENLPDQAWTDEKFEQQLGHHLNLAGQIGVRSVPTLQIGDQVLRGVPPCDKLRAAVESTAQFEQ